MIKYILKKLVLPKNYSNHFGGYIIQKFIKDFIANKSIKLPMKIWAYGKGFLSDKVDTWGLNDSNYQMFISDWDYYSLYPINKSATKWIDDKLTTRYILQPFSKYLPKHYFQLENKRILKLMDCPVEVTNDIEGVMHILRKKKELAVKQLAGSLGVGFYKFSYNNEKFFINNKEATRLEIEKLLNKLDQYIITEYIKVHKEIGRIFDVTPNALRVMMVYDEQDGPQITGAFLRIGTSKSGMVEHGFLGGICTNVDLNTGRFYDPRVRKGNVLEKCEFHPDTGVKIEGTLPHWQLIKEELVRIGEYIPQVTYMGWDIVITDEGFKILEINSHQNLDNMQYYHPVYKNHYSKKFFKKVIEDHNKTN